MSLQALMALLGLDRDDPALRRASGPGHPHRLRRGDEQGPQARAGALDELLASGALEDATVPGGRDDLQSQLDALTAGHDVDDELAWMKARLPASAPPAAIEGPRRRQPIRRRDRRLHRKRGA